MNWLLHKADCWLKPGGAADDEKNELLLLMTLLLLLWSSELIINDVRSISKSFWPISLALWIELPLSLASDDISTV